MIDAETENVSSENMNLVWNIVMKQYDQRDAGLLDLAKPYAYKLILMAVANLDLFSHIWLTVS